MLVGCWAWKWNNFHFFLSFLRRFFCCCYRSRRRRVRRVERKIAEISENFIFPLESNEWEKEEKLRISVCRLLHGRVVVHYEQKQKEIFAFIMMETHLSIPFGLCSLFSLLSVVFSNQHLYYFYDKSTLRMLNVGKDGVGRGLATELKLEFNIFFMIFQLSVHNDWCRKVLYEWRATCDVWQTLVPKPHRQGGKRNKNSTKKSQQHFPTPPDKWKSFIRPRHQLRRWKQTIRDAIRDN